MKDDIKVEIRKAVLDDCKALSILKKDVWETTYRGIYSDDKIDKYDYEQNENKFSNIIDDINVNLYVALNNNIIIGYVSEGKPYRPYGSYEQNIGLLYVKKEYQGIGIGKKLFETAYNSIEEKGFKMFFISCNKYNYNAQKFYQKMGGQVVHVDEDNEDKSLPQVKFHYDVK